VSTRDRHVVVAGCGRVGTGLATRLLEREYTVAVIDRDPIAFRRLGGLDVHKVEGVCYDRATLLEAGIERAQALAAVTNGDNSNIVVARTARDMFAVPRVVARIYDARRAALYERLGIATVASAALTIELAMRFVLPEAAEVRWIDPGARVGLVERAVPATWVGTPVDDLEVALGVRIVAVRRLGSSVLPTPRLVLQDGDLLHVAVTADALDDFEQRIAGGPEGGPR
jgi:trk system potassium uptake protein TrkA